MSPALAATQATAAPLTVARAADLQPVSPADVRVGDLVARREISEGLWAVQSVISHREGDHDPLWRCRRYEILVESDQDEDGFFGQPEKLPLWIVKRGPR